MTPDDPRHGTPAGYLAHGRDNETACPACRRGAARYEQARVLDQLSGRPRTLPAHGTRRRLQALAALGHSFTRMAQPLELTPQGVWALACRDRETVLTTTALKVATLYATWSMLLPPETTPRERHSASYARTTARKYGWPPPLAWDDIDHDTHPHPDIPHRQRADTHVDPVVIDRILTGDLVPATTAERRAVVAAWPSTGRSYADLARLTGWKVERYHHTQREDDAA